MTDRLPALTPRQVIRVLRQAGFVFHHQSGSHAHFHHHTSKARWVTVPMHATTIKKGTLRSIITQSGMSRKKFLTYL